MSSRNLLCRNGCGASFTDRSNRYRHETRSCIHKSEPEPRENKSKGKPKAKEKEKIRVAIKKKIAPIPVASSRSSAVDHLILEELRALRQQVNEMKTKTERAPVVNLNLNNCVIVGADVYQDIVDKLGRDHAIEYLTNENVDEVDIIEKIYLDDQDPNKYPIACRDNRHFRYLNDDRELIDDRGGSKVKELVQTRVHTAILHASIQREDQLSNNIQDMIAGNERDIIEKLSKVTYNPGHPFFGNDCKQPERKYRVMDGGKPSMAVIVSGSK